MDEIESNKNEIENNNINKEKGEISNTNAQILCNEKLDILNKIFKTSENDNSLFIPILIKNSEEQITKIFTEKPENKEESSFEEFILGKLKLISNIVSISKNSPEILQIISDYLLNKNTSIFIYIIELYFNYITLNKNKNMNVKIIEEIKSIFSNLKSCGLLIKKDVDYIYQKIAYYQLENKLSINIFNDIIPLLKIIYEEEKDINIKANLIMDKYFYFYDKDNSIIETNISRNNFIQIKNGFCIVLWFCLKETNEDDKNKTCLVNIKNEKKDTINILLNNKNDIEIMYNFSYNLKEKESKILEIKKNIWSQLTICITKNEIILCLKQNYNANEKNKMKTNEEFITKKYIISDNKIQNYAFYDNKIISINFFKHFIGIVGTILFLNEIDNNKKQNNEFINNLFKFKNKNVNDIFSDKNYSKNIFFVFSPCLYFHNRKIFDLKNNVIGRLPEIVDNKYNLNSIFSFHNYINNIFYLGGCNNFLPLFEIVYKFTLNKDNTNEINNEIINILNNLFELLNIVFSSKKNCYNSLQKENHFFKSLKIFLEKIDEKYYYNNEKLLNILLGIGKKFDDLKESKGIEMKDITRFFINIFFNPNITIKFSLKLQKKLLKEIKSFKVLVPFKQINQFLLLLSRKYKNNEIEKDSYSETLFNYINMIFENINSSDSDRESLFLLYQHNNNISNGMVLSDDIFIHIIEEVFIKYLDTKIYFYDKNEEKIKQRNQTVNYFLNSENFFIENLLKYLSTTNIHVKKVIINLLRVLTQIYKESLEQYFNKISKNKKNERITKDEFYSFIKENIAPNYNNEKIRGKNSSKNNSLNKNHLFYLEENESNNFNDSSKNDERILSDKNKAKKEIKNKSNHKRSNSFNNYGKKDNSGTIKFTSTMLSEKTQEIRTKSYNKLKSLKSEKEIKNVITFIPKSEKTLDKNKIIKNKEQSLEKVFNTSEANLNVALYLYNWLLSLIENKEKNKEEDEISIHHTIEYIVKFIAYTKDLEVILRIVLLIGEQKNVSEKIILEKVDKKIYQSLIYYLSSNSLFQQILIELLIHSYIYKTISEENIQEESNKLSNDSVTDKEIGQWKSKYTISIYEKALDILLDMFFLEKNKNKGGVLIKIFQISLKLLLIYQDKNDITKKNLLLKFIKQVLLNIDQRFGKEHSTIKKTYLVFLTFFMDYCFIFKNADEHLQGSYSDITDDRTDCLPYFIIDGLIFENEGGYHWAGNDIYKKMLNNVKKIFNIKNVFENLEIVYKGVNTLKEKEEYIQSFNKNWIDSLINEIISKKKRDEFDKKHIEALFYSYPDGGYDNNFPIINIISLFNSLNLYLFYSDSNTEINTEQLLSLLKNIQNFIVFLIITSLILNLNNFTDFPIDYEECQTLIYQNLFFNIQNILFRLNDQKNKKYFLQVLYNIILFLFILYNIEQTGKYKKKSKNPFKNIFSSSNNIDLSKTAPIMLINYFIKTNNNFFNENNILYFIKNEKEKCIKLIEDSIPFEQIKEMINFEDSPSFNLFSIEIFSSVVLKRGNDIETNLQLLIENEKESNKINDDYKNIYLKLFNIKNYFYLDEIKQQQKKVFEIKKYRKIKKELYSFNNSYSNLQVFYSIPLEQNPYLAKYKITNFLSKDLSRKVIKPIIDINYYMPDFRKYKYDSNEMFYHPNKDVYAVDLQIFKSEKKGFLYPDVANNSFYKKEYYLEDDVCYIKTSNHVKGVIYHLNNIENISENYIYFCITEQPNTKEKERLYVDFDSLNDSCFNSIFRNNMNKKDKDMYLKINLGEINFIFSRKYCYKDNALELFTSFHKSYYFKFKNTERRNKFLEHFISILNKDTTYIKKLFKPINSIDKSGKKIILGYFKDIENNSEFGNINNIKEMWKNCKISTFEYLMWINVYGNRSYRDISQYPVFPWIIIDYKTETFEDIINKNNIRNFTLPIGLIALNEKGKSRQEGYITTYRYMSLGLIDEGIVDFKVQDEDYSDDGDSNEENNNINNNTSNTQNTEEKSIESFLPKMPIYNYNIEQLYKNLSVEYDKIPYLFGSHYSNAMYISHYLGRLFPYSLTMIEIQGTGYDCPERLFICLQKTLSSATCEKCDVRELTPEFYTMPEFFVNINKLNFGEIKVINFEKAITYYDEFLEKNGNKEKVLIQDVLLPNWCKDNPYYFIYKKKELLENNSVIDLNPWIDLIFGYSQRGQPAMQIGNLFLPCMYDEVMNYRVKDEDLLNNRNDWEYKIRLFELGVNPTKVFDKKLTDKKKIMNKQISDIKGDVDNNLNFIVDNDNKNINFVVNTNSNNLLLLGNDYQIKKISIEEKNDSNKGCKTKEIMNYIFLQELFQNDKYYNLIIKFIMKYNMIFVAGFYSGNAYLFSLDKNQNIKKSGKNASKNKTSEKLILNYFKKGYITSLEMSQDEKYIVSGNNKGVLEIIELLNNNFSNNTSFSNIENNNNTKLLKMINSHNGHPINYISINSDLNLFGDCSNDNYIHIYTLPRCDKIISLYNKDSLFSLDFLFLCAQPLSSIILYSNKTSKFKLYNINGFDLNIEQSDISLLKESKYKNEKYVENMISPLIFTNSQFNDYLLYVFRYQFILLRKTPLMDLVFKINFDENEFISMINISLMKEYIYAFDNSNKKIYIINYDKSKNKDKDKRNSIDKINNNF